jgi:hypothetical protein
VHPPSEKIFVARRYEDEQPILPEFDKAVASIFRRSLP